MTLSPDVTAALATLRSRWGAAAPRVAGEVIGALAMAASAPEPDPEPDPEPRPLADPAGVFSTGFPELDAILGPGGLPRGMGLSLRGDLSSGRTTLALRVAAEAQASGAIVAWLDLAAAFDPVEAVARGIRPEWLVVLTPAGAEEGLAIAGALLSGRTVDLLVIDLPPRPEGAARFADRLGRLGALARRAGISLLVLEPPGLTPSVAAAVGEGTGIRLELARRAWVRLGRDVVGQAAEVLVARNRAGPPGRRATLRILYADGGERDACLRREALLRLDGPRPVEIPAPIHAPVPVPGTSRHATPPPLPTAPPPRSRPGAPSLRLVAGGTARPGRPTVDRGDGSGRGSRGQGPRRPARDAARVGSPAGPGGDVPRSGTGG
ncbi:MAG: DNA recombination/repair protein RecA [Chloroflexi bacterium]|nr:DNA recombination/repair protein RecA [Chloroflexota bacterium]